ncbi:alpha/beta hydrolase [Nocardia bovistercoris]|uniref:Alpha/beta hydrolase n=1 Tax=Nocardia bovistercoris TaxID=2785916 RepID=A0A931II39_9NOCA|nr:alpha/beta hydrolase [Nocardia bovistercoris]MBH0780780.1 alpha/beta hydrolase [Nocardia bovistercoris]
MTLTDTELCGFEDGSPTAVRAEVDGIPVSGLLVEAESPRAVVVALHGGATSSAYFDCPGHPELSLLRVAERLGYTVLALDRPGYGDSRPFADRLDTPGRRVDLMYGAVGEILGARPRGAGLFLFAHSAGCELAIRMAGDARAAEVIGLEIAGTGRTHQPEAHRLLWGRADGSRPVGLGSLLWHPGRIYPPDLVGGAAIAATGTQLEAATIANWAENIFPQVAARVRVPVHYTLGEFEKVWCNTAEDMTEIGALFEAAPRVVLNQQPNTGHNSSLGYTATAYHLRVLSFAEECVVAAETGEFSGPARQFDGGEIAATEVR